MHIIYQSQAMRLIYGISRRRASSYGLIIVALLLVLSGCKEEKPKKIVTVPAVNPTAAQDTVPLPQVDIAQLCRSLVDALNVGENLDSASYCFMGILTDGSGKPLFNSSDGKPGRWEVEVQSPSSVVISNIDGGNLLPEDLRLYVAQAIGFTDADVVDAGIAAGTDSVQAVIYSNKVLRMEMTLLSRDSGKTGVDNRMSIAFIRL